MPWNTPCAPKPPASLTASSKLVKPKDKNYVLSDGDGLQLRVRVNGSTLWHFNYRQPITKNRINKGLGTYPELSLAQARKKTVEARERQSQRSV